MTITYKKTSAIKANFDQAYQKQLRERIVLNTPVDLSQILSTISHHQKPLCEDYLARESSHNSDFIITFKRLLELTEIDPDLDENEEDEILNPSSYAVSKSIKQLIQLDELLGQSFPRGFSSLESRGGVNLIWKNPDFDKEIRVKIPVNCDFQESVYYRKGDDSELIKNPSLEKISQILLWLSTNQPII
ncbi:hypothetical protein PL8927_550204 [Planktothrix serta PCC 8927]|uniref:Uncharacterized protein n=1 Tax=Planktothrix serta PCC 8927 TaxID=671068 RepID=A0A7Z9BLG9_9CYAN|nr:hypothetical protein [Planktothrix serta]VXD17105.1 hypothetical protein PL8927_550204 [Planktothrix serta PCC 8927]